jgi:hypothetical protein
MGDTTLCGNKIYTIRTDTDTGFRIADTISTLCETYVRKDECPVCSALKTDLTEAHKTYETLQKAPQPKFGGYISKDVYIIKAIANNPAFIVFWSDGTKTTAKCSTSDCWDAEKGLAICILKKLQGNAWVQQLFADWAIDDGSWTLNELRKMHRYFNKQGK